MLKQRVRSPSVSLLERKCACMSSSEHKLSYPHESCRQKREVASRTTLCRGCSSGGTARGTHTHTHTHMGNARATRASRVRKGENAERECVCVGGRVIKRECVWVCFLALRLLSGCAVAWLSLSHTRQRMRPHALPPSHAWRLTKFHAPNEFTRRLWDDPVFRAPLGHAWVDGGGSGRKGKRGRWGEQQAGRK